MSNVVIVHGGWGGGWEWTAVAESLRRRGHVVITPTLSGMGDRSHLIGPISLETHVLDIAAMLEFEQLSEVILCAHSYGGIPATGAADRVPGRVALLVYIDAIVPRHGQALVDFVWPEFGEDTRTNLALHGDSWRMPIPDDLLPPEGCAPEPRRLAYIDRLRPQPARTFIDSLHLTGAVDTIRVHGAVVGVVVANRR